MSDPVRPPGLPAHPIDVLAEEHAVIRGVLHAIAARARLDLAAETLDAQWWLEAVQFLVNFADRCHHAKEEDLLFPALVSCCGLATDSGPIAVMLGEHAEGRELVRNLRERAERDDRQGLLAAADALAALLRSHTDKEDHVLFPLARRQLSAEVAGELLIAFADADAALPSAATKPVLLSLARRLTAVAPDNPVS